MPAKPNRKPRSPARKAERLAAASQAIGSTDVIHLTERERQKFISALLNPPEPSTSLKAAAKRYFNR